MDILCLLILCLAFPFLLFAFICLSGFFLVTFFLGKTFFKIAEKLFFKGRKKTIWSVGLVVIFSCYLLGMLQQINVNVLFNQLKTLIGSSFIKDYGFFLANPIYIFIFSFTLLILFFYRYGMKRNYGKWACIVSSILVFQYFLEALFFLIPP